MTLDLSECEIHSPRGDKLRELCRFLINQFPSDRPVLDPVIEAGQGYATWTPYGLYHRGRLLGSLALMPLKVWLDRRFQQVVGVASVATDPKFRRMGVARRLLDHCLGLTERQAAPTVLFTSLPEVYRSAGFREIQQQYVGTCATALQFGGAPPSHETRKTLDGSTREILAGIYGKAPSFHTGKIERDADYWQFYERLFNSNRHVELLLLSREGRTHGYARLESEGDRLLVSELCVDSAEESLLASVCTGIAGQARQQGVEWVTLALPADHCLREFLNVLGVSLALEPPGAARESFMVRPAGAAPIGALASFLWPLSDKF